MEEKDLRELRKLNKEEMLFMIKEYLKMYILLMLKNDKNKQKIVQKELKNYIKTISAENRLYKYLEKNIKTIKNKDTLDDILYQLDILNEKTYNYYDQILLACEENINSDYNVIPYKNFNTITETDKYINEVVGLTLTFQDVLDFYHEYSKELKELLPKIKVLNTKSKEAMSFYGAYPIEQDNKVINIKICVPAITNLKETLINVHEIKHGIDLLPCIGKAYQELDYEEKAKETEKIFIKEYLPKKCKV